MTQPSTRGSTLPRSVRAAAATTADDRLADQYGEIRKATEELCASLTPEDAVVQSMPDASPAKWHLAHTTWFFETFVLEAALDDYRPIHSRYRYLFNSYYNTVGPMHPRPERGLLTRPSLAEVYDYRRKVDEQVGALLDDRPERLGALRDVVRLGMHHEQQHQELILTDIKHAFSCNPLLPSYRSPLPAEAHGELPMRWLAFEEGIRRIGHSGSGFSFDNERPRHRVFVDAFELASRPITNGEFLDFVEDGGYRTPELWLSDGWRMVEAAGLEAPMYWHRRDGCWVQFTLSGIVDIDRTAPVCHVSFYEAHAFTRWIGARLPTEAEWEFAVQRLPVVGNFSDSGRLHPVPCREAGDGPLQMFGDVWEWTRSPYTAYPGYQEPDGALGEYNGKFMSNQMVLRGGSCATPRSHIRATYRNFFPPDARWQFSGFRLARDAGDGR